MSVSVDRPGVAIPVRYRTRHADGSWRIIEGTYTNLLDDPDIAGIVPVPQPLPYDLLDEELAAVAVPKPEETK